MKSQAVIHKDQRKTWRLDDDKWLASAAPRSGSLRVLFPIATVYFWFDVLLLGVFSANVLTAFINPSLHIPSGIMVVLTIHLHLLLHWGFWVSGLKGLWEGRLRLHWKWLLNVGLLMTFVPTVLSGMLVAVMYAPNVSVFHKSSAVVFFLLVAIHLCTSRNGLLVNAKNAVRHGQNSRISKRSRQYE